MTALFGIPFKGKGQMSKHSCIFKHAGLSITVLFFEIFVLSDLSMLSLYNSHLYSDYFKSYNFTLVRLRWIYFKYIKISQFHLILFHIHNQIFYVIEFFWKIDLRVLDEIRGLRFPCLSFMIKLSFYVISTSTVRTKSFPIKYLERKIHAIT